MSGRKMPRRPLQHQLADASERAFARVLPQEWVFRPEQKDYGIDGEVEIFTGSGQATGMLFKVQLKSTSRVGKRALAVRLRDETAAYYASLGLPVLLVLFHAPSETLYAKWFHSFDPHYGGVGQDHTTMVLRPEHAWSDETPRQLQADVEMFYRLRNPKTMLPLSLTLDVGDEVRGVSGAELRVAVRELSRQVPGVVRLAADRVSDAGTLSIREDQIRADLRGVASATVHFTTGTPSYEDARSLASDALLCLALACAHLGLVDAALRLVEVFGPFSPVLQVPEVGIRFVGMFTYTDRVIEALDLADRLAEQGDQGMLVDILLAPALSKGPHLTGAERQRVTRFLEARLAYAEARGDREGIAAAYYNLANWYRSQSRYDDGLRHYAKAAEFQPDYPNRAYYHKEMAGCLFETGKFVEAADSYRRAVELGEGGGVEALRADALMMAGRYAEALSLFTSHNAAGPANPEWILKEWVLQRIRELVWDSQKRHSDKAAVLADVSDPGLTNEEREDRLVRALHEDALWPGAWFNLGVLFEKTGRLDEAATAFATCAVLARWDVEAWAHAIVVTGRNPDSPEQLGLLVSCAYILNGPRVMEVMARMLRDAKVPEAFSAPLLEFAEHVIQQTAHPHEAVVRIPTPDGGFIPLALAGSAGQEDLPE